MVYLVGAGPGDPDLITVKGRAVLSRAEVVVYDYLASPDLLACAPQGAELIYSGKKAGAHSMEQADINALLVEKGRSGKVVVRLKGGDPFMFGRGGEEAEALVEAGLEFEVVPGVTSAVAAAAYAGIPLTDRRYASSVTFATGHEDPDKKEPGHDWQALARSKGTLVFFMGMKNLPEIAARLMKAGLDPATPAALVQWGTTPRHRSLATSLEKLPAEAEAENFTSPSIIIIGQAVAMRNKLAWFEKRPLLGKTVVATRTHEKIIRSKGKLTDQGCEVIHYPTLRLEPLDPGPAYAALGDLAGFDWVVFSSDTGVTMCWERLREMGKDARAFAGCRIAAVGPVTAEALAGRGLVADLVPSPHTGEEMGKALAREGVKGKSVLLIQALKARPMLEEILRQAGAAVRKLPLYDTLPAHAEHEQVMRGLEQGGIDCITFGSPSAVRYFLERIPADTLRRCPKVKFACIGPVTAGALEEAGLTCHILPAENTLEGLVQALKEKL